VSPAVWRWHSIAGEHGLVHAAFALEHDAIGRKHFAGPHHELIAHGEFHGLHVLGDAVAHAPRRHGREACEGVGDAAGAMPRDHLDVAPEPEEETNIVTESKYTSPTPVSAFHTLATNARMMPRLTGTSMLMLRERNAIRAP